MASERSCGAVLYRRRRGVVHYLLLKHVNGYHWSLAKGHAEAGESEAQTALREVFEETGLTVTLTPGFRETITYETSPGTEKTVIYFIAKSPTKKVTLQKSEIFHAVWLELEDALRLVSHPNVADVLRRADVYLKS